MIQTNYEAHAPTPEFKPTEQLDVIPGYDENDKRLKESRDRYFDDLIKQEMNLAKGQDNAIAKLGELVPSIAKVAKPYLEGQRKKKAAEGYRRYSEDKEHSTWRLQEREEFEVGEAALKNDQKHGNQIAAEADRAGAPPWLVQELFDASSNGDYWYVVAALQDAAQTYPAFKARAYNNFKHPVLNTKTGKEELQTLANATGPEERGSIEAAIFNMYYEQFINPDDPINPKVLDKYLFDSMRKHDEAEATKFAQEQRALTRTARKEIRKEELFTNIKTGVPTAFVDYVNANEYELGGNAAARDNAIDLIVDGLKDKSIMPFQVAPLLTTPFPARGGEPGSETTMRDLWPQDAARLETALTKAYTTNMNDREKKQKADGQAYQTMVDKYVADKDGPLTNNEKEQILQGWDYEWGQMPDWLKHYPTIESQDDDALEKSLKYKLQNGGIITKKDVEGFSDFKKWEKWNPKVNDPLALSPENLANAKKIISAAVTEFTEENDARKDKTVKWQQMNNKALRGYVTHYNNLVKQGREPLDAHLKALDLIQADLIKPGYHIPVIDSGINIGEALKAIQDDPTIPESSIIPGTQSAFEQLKKNAEKGIFDIPEVYYQLTIGQKITALQLANAQLSSQGLPELVPPNNFEKDLETKDPEQQRLLKFKPTQFRLSRYHILDEGGDFNSQEYLLPGLTTVNTE